MMLLHIRRILPVPIYLYVFDDSEQKVEFKVRITD